MNPFLVILLAAMASWLFGAVWYTALSKPYQRAQGLNPDDCKDQKMPMVPLAVAFLGAVVMSAVMYEILSFLGLVGGVPHAAQAGLTIGLGLLFTSVLVNNMFQGKPFLLTLIDGGHWTLVLAIQAMVIELLRS